MGQSPGSPYARTHRLGRARRAAAMLAIVVAAASAPARLGAQVSVHGETVQERRARAGESYAGSVRVANATDRPQVARVYLTDYAFDAEGATRYDAPGSHPRSSAPWIALEVTEVVVPPGASALVRYHVRVPAGAVPGTHWSLLMVEGVGAADTARAPRTLAVATVVRYGVQIATHVDEGGGAGTGSGAGTGADTAVAVTISAPRATQDGGVPALTFDLANAGLRGVRPLVRVQLLGADGAVARELRQQRGLLYPGTSLRQRFALDGLPAGDYVAVVTVDCGDDALFATQVALRW